MTKLLKEVLAKLSKLPPERQDDLAALLLEEIEADTRWEESFAKSQSALEKLADEAADDRARGRTRPFDVTTLSKKR
jgi:hypothetical protein